MLQDAFKEWAVICQALAAGHQALILRKGGIAETGGTFHLEHTRFWLFPTYVHQQAGGIKPEALPLLQQAEAQRPPTGLVRLGYFAEVAGVYQLHDLVGALRIRDLHLWSDETVQSRFRYRTPGLYVLAVRVYRSPAVHELRDTADYAGCRTWVKLEQPLPTEGATAVLEENVFQALLRQLDDRLNPTALA
jgi:hypothetical protein